MKIKYSLEQINETIDKLYVFLKNNKNKNIILFEGKMGVGKTTLIKKLCEKLGVTDEVTSPTFAIINEYKTKNNDFIYHFDFYRIKNIEEALNIGTEDYFFSTNYCFIEWAEIIKPILPNNFIEIKIKEIDSKTRELKINTLLN